MPSCWLYCTPRSPANCMQIDSEKDTGSKGEGKIDSEEDTGSELIDPVQFGCAPPSPASSCAPYAPPDSTERTNHVVPADGSRQHALLRGSRTGTFAAACGRDKPQLSQSDNACRPQERRSRNQMKILIVNRVERGQNRCDLGIGCAGLRPPGHHQLLVLGFNTFRVVIKELRSVEQFGRTSLQNINFIQTRLYFLSLFLYLLDTGSGVPRFACQFRKIRGCHFIQTIQQSVLFR
mmetsp:Transcript_59614/g.124532  ORF Transcript_59614/g.124532 Transcript_59614/m.124532 type:complete len:235 (+) Transcript_59614:108-812(+)